MSENASQDELVRQNVDHICGPWLAVDPDRQAFPGELVNQVEHPDSRSELAPVSTGHLNHAGFAGG
jgi:hypothetical protein